VTSRTNNTREEKDRNKDRKKKRKSKNGKEKSKGKINRHDSTRVNSDKSID